MQSSALPHAPITAAFGAELERGINLQGMDDEAVDALQQLAAERGVVVVRDQVMTMQEQVDFGRRIGELFTTPVARPEIPDEIIVIHANEKSRFVAGMNWHSDVSSEEVPPGLSMLRLEVTPKVGGDTLFADMRQVFSTLSPAMQEFLLGMTARHDPKGHYLYVGGVKRLDELPSAVHPVVRTHPLTGKRALFVNEGFTGAIVGLSDRESSALLKMLYDHIAYTVRAQIRVHWEPNTVVFWDNRVVQHMASWDYYPDKRFGFRVTVRGEAPYLDTASAH
ncbi:MAG: taurine dioxygenase [Gammaproteobacteria bacterium]|nr:taurine dioxygenase [Gammaproteobacteria bacterium]